MSRTLLIRSAIGLFIVVALFGITFATPAILASQIENEREQAIKAMHDEFPVTVNPHEKSIVESDSVNAFLESPGSPMQAAVGDLGSVLRDVFDWVAITIANAPLYQSLAAVDARFVTIEPGMRKEQVATAFAKVLKWNAAQKKEFLTQAPYASLPLTEGSFSPGIYSLTSGMTPQAAQQLVNDRFNEDILARYSTTTAQIVPLKDALTIASMIEREAGGADDMRIISGIIWNRLFINMRLQIDATVQYAKANTAATNSWWPKVLPSDTRRKSPYNTYQNTGLPPTPIANPSVASVLAALNPKKTDCIFYFHDASRGFHCSETYQEHVALLKKYYGRGK